MSYIRALSNPESLYIIGSQNGDVEFMGVPDWGGVHRPDVTLYMPARIFEKIMLTFLEEREEITCQGAQIVLLTRSRLGQPDIDWKNPETWDKKNDHPDLHKWRLTYPERWGVEGVNAWEVTWCYIAQKCKRRRGEKPWYEDVAASKGAR